MTTHRLLPPALAILGLLAAATPFVTPVAVQAQRAERVLTIFGNDPCPSSNGEEIVVCQRMPEGERYRIPEELRRTEGNGRETWGDRAKSLEYVGKSGAQSCSTSGPGGASGCFRELARKACDEDKADGKKCGIKF
ncbi:hypothetical protein [Rhizorhabdus dicambivorans]|uniref:DUF4189 domain-containing protein n=1 Tax=Rhizorhabdus dicambivorans TaxID=1850238 RepID=A0A2A4FUM6_9SPHN|nr:hypothetical protein [Rhizorhabdus dicambivorans]ATE63562.1 hypothetical protein CMV14_03360 [Rhizorhabdus dicambivorans]PCE41382.1 hypothetical protein COO09_15020 [Rhizorhabdus dicambivorans]